MAAIPDLMLLYSWDGIYLKCIKQNAAINFLPADENPNGKHLSEVLPAAVAERHLQAIREIRQSGEMQIYEQQVRVGERLQYEEVRVVPCGEEGVLLMIRDISERKQAEQALQQLNQELEARVSQRTTDLQHLQERLQFIVASSPGAVYTCQATGSFSTTFVSPNVREMFGYSVSDYLTDSQFWYNHIHPDDRAALLADLEPLFKGELYTYEYRFLHQDGSYRWVYDQCHLIRDEQGNPIEVVGCWVDITDRKRIEAERQAAQQEVSRNRDLWQAIFNESTDALFLVDAQTLLNLDCNSKAVELFEADSKESLIGIEGHTLQRYQFSDEEMAAIVEEIQSRGCWSREIEYVSRKGRHFWGNIAAKSITVAGRQMNLVRVTDISERKRADDQIKTSLKEKEVMLKEIHHRVKNNLQIIISLLRLQASTIADPKTLAALADSRNRIRSMALIHEKLYQSNDLAHINFASYVQNLASEIFASYGIDAIAVQLRLDITDIAMSVDRAIPCGLIINELLSNALKYAFPDQQAGEVFIEMYRTPYGNYRLTIGDNGIGLPEDFDFQQASSLGLNIVQNLVLQLSGSIVLERRQGTVFRITF